MQEYLCKINAEYDRIWIEQWLNFQVLFFILPRNYIIDSILNALWLYVSVTSTTFYVWQSVLPMDVAVLHLFQHHQHLRKHEGYFGFASPPTTFLEELRVFILIALTQLLSESATYISILSLITPRDRPDGCAHSHLFEICFAINVTLSSSTRKVKSSIIFKI